MILAISGSLSRSSVNSAALRAAAARRHATAIASRSTTPCGALPHFDPDLEAAPPDAVLRFRAACERRSACSSPCRSTPSGSPARSRTRSTGRSAAAPSTGSRSRCSTSHRPAAARTSARRSTSC